MSEVSVPTARRLHRPSWRDARLVIGVLLVLLSVLGGARLIASFDDSTPVYAAARPLLPGQEVSEQDLTSISVRLQDTAGRYVDAARPVRPGTFVLRTVQVGELLPLSAVGSAQQVSDKTVTVPIDPAAASTLDVGSVVDIWVSRRDDEAPGTRYLDPELLVQQALVADVPADPGALGMGVGRAAVQVVVPAADVAAVISSVDQEARLTLVPAPGPTAGSGR
ncbi:MAG: hypothetical protein H0U62_09650 [Actinobacteria bacterium]|nr:hypothetical protein [Actinomycetota bacterium]